MNKAQEASPQRREDTTAGVDVSRPGSHQSTLTEEAVHDINADSNPTELDLEQIFADDSVRTREVVNEEIVKAYADQMRARVIFPPVRVFTDDTTYWLGDGFHRVEAAKRAGRDKIAALVQKGTRLDAIKFGFKANDRHGLRRTNADKRYAVGLAIKEFRCLSSNAIAELCGVDHQLVAKVRRQLGDSPSSTVGRDGKTRKVLPKVMTKSTSNKAMSKPAAASGEEPQVTTGDKADPFPLADCAQTPAPPEQEQNVIAAPVTAEDVDGDCAPPVSGVAPAAPQAVITVPAGGEEVEFVLADGYKRRVPWFQNRLTFKDVDDHVQKMKAFYESKDAFPKYDHPTLVKFQNALISAASLAVSILGNNPTPIDLEIAHNALNDIRGMLPDLPRT